MTKVCSGDVKLNPNYSGILGVAGGLLDIVVGSSLVQIETMQPQAERPMMGGQIELASTGGLMTGALLIALGLIVLVTGIYSFGSLSMSRMRGVGGLMLAYGVAMILVGLSMFYGLAGMMMQGAFLSGSLMLVVGVLMILSGSGMLRKPSATM